MMNFDPKELTNAVAQALGEAHTICVNRHQSDIDIPQLFKFLIQPGNLDRQIYSAVGLDLKSLNHELDNELDSVPVVSGSTAKYGDSISSNLENLLEKASSIKKKLGDSYIAIDTLALAEIKIDCPLTDYLKQNGVTYGKLLKAIKKIRGGAKVNNKDQEDTFNALKKYGVDLVKEARNGKLPPVIGRDAEILDVIKILSKMTKDNALLLGQPGVGKTAIVEGLAERIAHNDVPDNLRNKEIFSLDLSSVVAGAKYRGQFEQRIKSVLKAVEKAKGKIIMFIDEIHTVMGAGKAQGSLDASNILKPALARGELHVIGATTYEDYHKYMAKDEAFDRRFQIVKVNEPTVEDTLEILRGIRSRFEIHNGVRIHDNALVAAAKLSDRYITDRYLPDKAIDLVDEASATIKVQMNSRPADLDEVSRKLVREKIEKAALSKETDDASQKRLSQLKPIIANTQEKVNAMNARWLREKHAINQLSTLRKKLHKANNDLKQAETNYEYNQAAVLKHGTIPKLKEQVTNLTNQDNAKDFPVSLSVTAKSIADVLSQMTGIPVDQLTTTDRERLLHLPDILHKRVIGQDEAVNAVSNSILRKRAGVADPTRPSSFLLMGPTGTGKTELSKALAQALFGSDTDMIRIDMSEYMTRASVSRLVGSAPGLVGYQSGGQLTNAVDRHPYSVILLDEIEKANPAVFNLLLQVLDDGRLTDNRGKTANFRNSIIIMTSNLGSQALLDGTNSKGQISDKAKNQVKKLLKAEFKPEFLNRIDEKIMFKPLSIQAVQLIVAKMVRELNDRLEQRSMSIKTTKSAQEYIAKKAYSPIYGARPLARYITSYVETPIAKMIIKGTVKPKQSITVDSDGTKLEFKVN